MWLEYLNWATYNRPPLEGAGKDEWATEDNSEFFLHKNRVIAPLGCFPHEDKSSLLMQLSVQYSGNKAVHVAGFPYVSLP